MGLADHVINGGLPFDLPVLKPFFVSATGGLLPRPEELRQYPGFLDAQIRYDRVAGDYSLIGLDLGNSSGRRLSESRARLLQTKARLEGQQLASLTKLTETEKGIKEGPICNMSLISQYLKRYMDLYRPVISADILVDDHFQKWFFSLYLYSLFRLGESE
jgi:hypothetical protein